MSDKRQVVILCGGQSTEHEISLLSAKNIIAGFDPHKYDLHIIYINHAGQWAITRELQAFCQAATSHELQHNVMFTPLTLKLGGSEPFGFALDCIFPVLHGTFGEDGTMQGLLALLQKPYVGCDVLSSAMAMNKAVAKELLQANGINVVPWIEIPHHLVSDYHYHDVAKKLGEVLFIKPVHLGSSVGIHKVSNQTQWQNALNDAFRFDDSVLIESAITGRELECAVLGNEAPRASLPGELMTSHEFYSYTAKYHDEQGTKFVIPAALPAEVLTRIQHTAIKAFKILRGLGMARVDFFLSDANQLYVNEINPIPGFTNISMYPKMWAASGMSYAQLLDELVALAIDWHTKQSHYQRAYQPEHISTQVRNA